MLHSLLKVGSAYQGVNKECCCSGKEDADSNPAAKCHFCNAEVAVVILLYKLAVVIISNSEFAFGCANNNGGVFGQMPTGGDGNYGAVKRNGVFGRAVISHNSTCVCCKYTAEHVNVTCKIELAGAKILNGKGVK